ncbi:unnamed protein product [Cochlearia groenlandica]
MRRNLMMEEDKQLDFNLPLISIRRPATTQTLEAEKKTKTRSFDSSAKNKNPPPPSSPPLPPVYKSDIKSGPVRNPGTVPFQWEHKPGKPKIERESVSSVFVEPPKLPPGRVLKGNLRLETKANVQTKTIRSNDVEDVKSYISRYDDACNDDGGSDGIFLEVSDRLSRTESFFYNCSNVSGGVDGHGLLVEPFGTLSSDRQTQDLMMGRFLPAAKALTSETTLPRLAKKPPKPQEPSRQVMKKVVQAKERQDKGEIGPYRYKHSRSDSQEEEEDGDMSSSMASGVCGILPQICLRSSFGLLNTVPSVRLQAQRAVSVRRMRSKYQDSTTCNEYQNKQTNETMSEDKRKLKPNDSASGPKVSKNFGELLASDDDKTWEPLSEDHVAEKTLYVDTVHSVDKKVQEEYKEHTSLDVVGPPVKDVQESIGAVEEAILQPKATEKMKDNNELSSLKECDDGQAIVVVQESNVVVEKTEEKIDLEVQYQRNRTNLERSRHIVPPPPLPEAPSDSWLKRTLPKIPSKKNTFTWLQQHSLCSDDDIQYFTNKTQANPKWETMVKTSNTQQQQQQGFVCFSKESLNTIPEA